jgi:hypothetical protein
MRVSEEALKEFKLLLEKKCPGRVYTDQEAFDLAMRILLGVHAVYQPIPKEKWAEYCQINNLS